MIIAPSLAWPAAFQSVSARTIAANITSNDSRVGWVSSSPGRSTSDILWSCFSILLVCTWKCLHFNIPRDEERDAGWHKFLWDTVPYWPKRLLWRKWFKRVGFIILIILAPEIGVAIAMDQYLFARESQQGRDVNRKENVTKMEKVKEDSEIGGNDAGEVVEKGPSRMKEREIKAENPEVDAIYQVLQREYFGFGSMGMRIRSRPQTEIVGEQTEITETHAFLANMGGFRIQILFSGHQQKDEAHPLELRLLDWKSLGQL